MRKLLLATAALIALATPAAAGSNGCSGTVIVGKEWSMIKANDDGRNCRFKTASKVGRKILATCKAGSTCDIEIDLPRNGDVDSQPKTITINKMLWFNSQD